MALTEPAPPRPPTPPPTGAVAPGARPPVPPPGGLRRRAALGSRRRQAVAGVIVAGAIAFLVAQGLGNATQYYKTVPQAVTDRATLGHNQFRMMGSVDDDVRQVDGQTEFSITYGGVTAPVVDRREPPQLFKAGIPVVLEGHWSGAVFQSDLIMVKHTAIYNPAEKAVMSTMPGNSLPAPSPAGSPAGAGARSGSTR